MSDFTGRRGETPFADAFVASFIRVRGFREMSLQELSDATGISKSYLSELQNDKTGGLSLEYAVRIANALGQPLATMIYPQVRDDGAPTTNSRVGA